MDHPMARVHWLWRGLIALLAGSACGCLWYSCYRPVSDLAEVIGRFLIGDNVASEFVNGLIVPVLLSAGSSIVALCSYAGLTRIARSKHHHGRETRCRKCGYILRGIPEPRCSECGERI
jgi:hypothetical protein